MRNATSRWIIAFLILVDLGVVLARAHQIFPWLNLFPEIPRTQNRIISWYILVYVTLQFGVVPPIVFVRSLRTAGAAESRAGDLDLSLWFRGLGPTRIGCALGVITSWTQ